MIHVEASYQNGVFVPLEQVKLPENQRVRLTFEAVAPKDWQEWLAAVQKRHEEFVRQHGYLPDSTPEIARDRLGDV